MPSDAGELYTSKEAERRIDKLYTKTLAALPFSAHELTVQTPTFGAAHVTVAGKQDGPPLMLWHGAYNAGPSQLSFGLE